MKILVTGGYGFIGSHLVERLMKERHHVTIIDDLSTGKLSNVTHKTPSITLSVEDKKCEKIFADTSFDVVVHLACKALPKENSKEFGEIIHSNNSGLSNILYLSHKYDVKKLIIISSYQIYGRQSRLPINEAAHVEPVDEYGRSYMIMESYCEEYRNNGLNVVVLRLASVYGPRQTNNFINQLIEHTVNDESGTKKNISNQIKDYIYISDAVEAIFNACVNHTSSVLNISSATSVSKSEIQTIVNTHLNFLNKNSYPFSADDEKPRYLIDNKKAISELEWSPKYSIEEGIGKTVEWAEKNKKSFERVFAGRKVIDKGKKRISGSTYKYLENVAAFLFFALFTYFIQKYLAIKVDFMIIYIVLINAFYGWHQGSISIALSSIAYIWLKMTVDDSSIASLLNDPNPILYMAMYFIIGVSVGYVIDRMKFENNLLMKDLESAQEEVQFTNDMYEKSIEIKNSLQNTIENYEDSLGKIFDTISRLDKVIPEQILSEAAAVYSKILKTESVHIYYLNSERHLRLAAVRGGLKYHKSLLLEDFTFLSSVIDEKKVFVNRELKQEYPMICAPIVQDGSTQAVVLLDGVIFKSLTHQFLNTLKVLSFLVANKISKAAELEEAIHDKKYYGNTFIMKSEWFCKLISEMQVTVTENEMPIYLLEFKRDLRNNEEIYSRVSKIIRPTDFIGEMSSERFGILLPNISKEEVSALEKRLSKQGIVTNTGDVIWRPL